VFALHNGVPDGDGTGGEFFVRGVAEPVEDPAARSVAAAAASFEAADRYVLFELTVAEARCNGYGDVTLPDPRRWRDPEARAAASAASGPVTSEREAPISEPATTETSKRATAKRGAAKRGAAKQGAAKRATSGRGARR
jgi:hypothetical protein